jgi:hypothetical protein
MSPPVNMPKYLTGYKLGLITTLILNSEQGAFLCLAGGAEGQVHYATTVQRQALYLSA